MVRSVGKFRGSRDDEGEANLEEVPCELVGGGLEIVFAVVGAGGGEREAGGVPDSREAGAEQREAARGEADGERRVGAGEGEGLGESGVSAEKGRCESAERGFGGTHDAGTGRHGDDGNRGVQAVARGGLNEGQERSERIGACAEDGIIELGVAADRKKVRTQGEREAPGRRVPGRREGVVGKSEDRAVRIVGGELTLGDGVQIGRKAHPEEHLAAVGAEEELDREEAGIGLVECREELLGVLGTALVVWGDGQSDKHGE